MGEGFSPYGRGPATHGTHRQGPDHGEERLAPDTGAVLDHATGNWKEKEEETWKAVSARTVKLVSLSTFAQVT